MTAAFQARKYTTKDKLAWDTFVAQAKNASFLFRRDFMEYHSDRFTDFSLLIYKDESLVGLIPANEIGEQIVSHQGLSYGGLVLANKVKFKDVLGIFKAALTFLASEGKPELQLKVMPKIYHRLPADELDYLLFLMEAKQTRLDISSTIDLRQPLKIQSNRTEGVKKAQKNELQISEGIQFEPFWEEILTPNLKAQHNAAPVHTVSEIKMLAARFPKNIKQFNVLKEDKIVAGATIFETEHLAHVQYISANAQKQQLGSLDFLFHYLITTRYKDKRYFDFGVSNVNQGKNINEGLLYWKECFGARSIAHSFYSVATANHIKLDSVFI